MVIFLSAGDNDIVLDWLRSAVCDSSVKMVIAHVTGRCTLVTGSACDITRLDGAKIKDHLKPVNNQEAAR